MATKVMKTSQMKDENVDFSAPVQPHAKEEREELKTSQMQDEDLDFSTPVSTPVQQHVKAETASLRSEVQLNPNYFRSISAIVIKSIRIIQIIFAILCMILISPPLTWFSRLFTVVVAVSFAFTVIPFSSYFITLKKVIFPHFDWILVEFVFTATTALSYLIVSTIQLDLSSNRNYGLWLEYWGFYRSYIAAGVFGLLNFAAYSVGAFFVFKKWRGNRSMNNIGPNGHA